MNATKETARDAKALLAGIIKALPKQERNIAFANIKMIERFLIAAEVKLPAEKKPKTKEGTP